MREILFRGKPKTSEDYFFFSQNWKDNCEKGFVYGNLIVSKSKYYICVSAMGKLNCCINNGTVSMIEVIPETVGQYTGLTDKNGKKIWEGDIVKATVSYNNALQDRVDVKTNIYEVKYHEKYCYFYLARKQNNLLFDGNWSYYLKEIEVIGNIHDNSELLKGGDGE